MGNNPFAKRGTKMENNFDLKLHLHRLLQDEPFFAAISRRVNKQESRALPTAGVLVDKETLQFQMLYNPDFFKGMEDNKIKGVLIHEFYHLVLKHVTSRKPDGIPNIVWNIAADLAINSIIGADNLPSGCCIPGGPKFESYPHGLTAEAYLEMMKEDEQFGDGKGGFKDMEGESGSDFGNFDDHGEWGKLSEDERQMVEERAKDIMEKAVKEVNASGRSWGSVSSQMKKDIMESLKTRVDWRKVLRAFIGASQRADKSNTMRKINRRFPYIHAGRKVNRVANIAISIDQSGSVSDQELNAFFNELNKLSDLATFTVIPFDTRVAESKVYVWKKGEKRKWERVMCGGTCFNAPTDYVNAGNWDGHIILTDLMAPKPKPSRCRRMWMASKRNVDSIPFKTNERVIAIDVKD
jgi:predicted metal-dependent peptidase